MFDGLSIMIPEPLAFSPEGYGTVLEEHARLLAEHQQTLLLKAQAFECEGDPLELMSSDAGLIRVRRDEVEVKLLWRPRAVEATRSFRGVCRALYLDPGPYRLQVVVVASGVVSLHTLQATPRGGARKASTRMMVIGRDEVVEPRDQKHRQEGPWTITRWVGPDREPRYAWVPTPAEPTDEDEALRRLLDLYEATALRRLWDFIRSGYKPSDALVYVSSSSSGDSVSVLFREACVPLALGHPKILRAIQEETRPGWVPVLFYATRWVGLRWIELAMDGDEPPAEIVEVRRRLQRAADRPPEGPRQGAVATAPPRKRAPGEWLAAVVQMGIDDEVDRLATLSDEELDGEMVEVGFDPAVERAKGPGLRERVVRAIRDKQLEKDPPAPAS